MVIRKIVRSRVLDICGLFSKPQNGIHILNGHRIALQNPTSQVFEQQLTLLSKRVRFIRFEDAVQRIIKRENPIEPIVAFSFDDGFEEHYTMVAPVLEKFGINAAFFINPNFVEGDEIYIRQFTEEKVLTLNKRPMQWDQIIDLDKRGHVIGAHTLDHYMINDDNRYELEHQIGDCKTIIEAKLGKSCDYFAFPYGRLEHANPMSVDIASKHYLYIFSQSDYKHYFSFDNHVINRRHFEPDWNIRHVNYFLSCKKKY